MLFKKLKNKNVSRDRANATPEPFDVHVWRRVGQRRTMLGISQAKLAEALELTF